MTTNPLRVTPDEIAKFEAELEIYRNSDEAVRALDKIKESDGYLVNAVYSLNGGIKSEETYTVNSLLQKSKEFICKEEIREALETGILIPAIEAIIIGTSLPVGIATATAICAFKLGMKKVCAVPSTQTPAAVNPDQ